MQCPTQGFAGLGGLATYPIISGSQQVVVSDFNGDGMLDLAAADYQNGAQVSVLLNKRNGTFGPQATYPTGAEPTSLAAGDFDGDGYPDLAVINGIGTDSFGTTPPGSVSVLLNQRDGTFGPQVVYGIGRDPVSIATADFNGDGLLDLAVANRADGNVGVLLNLDGGTFAPQATYPAGGDPNWIATGDIDGDGFIDLVIANGGGTVCILPNQGDGSFGAPIPIQIGNVPVSLVVEDLNGDGQPDLAVVAQILGGNQMPGQLSILVNLGGGNFASPVTYIVGREPTGIGTGDFNGDGVPDLVIGNSSDGNVGVLLNQGDGTFSSPMTYPCGYGPTFLAVGDLNGDGKPDVAVPTLTGFAGLAVVSVLLSICR